MKRIGRLLLKLLVFVALCLGLYIGATNRELVHLDLLFRQGVEVRSGYLLVFAFAAGGLLGWLAGLVAGRAAAPRRPAPLNERRYP